jgi:hypothetical protein
MPKGNSFDPFTHGGIDGPGYSEGDFGPADACYVDHIDSKANRRKDKEAKLTEEKTVVDAPVRASVARVKRTSAQAYEPDDWCNGPKEG